MLGRLRVCSSRLRARRTTFWRAEPPSGAHPRLRVRWAAFGCAKPPPGVRGGRLGGRAGWWVDGCVDRCVGGWGAASGYAGPPAGVLGPPSGVFFLRFCSSRLLYIDVHIYITSNSGSKAYRSICSLKRVLLHPSYKAPIWVPGRPLPTHIISISHTGLNQVRTT